MDNMRSFGALYLRPNDEGGGHFVYNINTMQRCSVGRVIGINKKPIPMADNVIETINKQAKEELEGIEYADINLKTTLEDYQERGDDSDDDFEYDDKSYETSDDSTVNGDNDIDDDCDDETDEHDDDHNDPIQEEEGQ